MNSTESAWWSVRAGEYVLGTLRDHDLELFKKILRHDSKVQAEVARWEQQLSGLNLSTSAQTPADHLYPEILDKIRNPQDTTDSTLAIGTQAFDQTINSDIAGSAAVITSESLFAGSKLRIWQTIAGLATAACLILGVFMAERLAQPDELQLSIDGLAVVLSDEDGKPFFLVETDHGNLRVRVTALSPPSLDESRDFQLWQALPDRSAVRPVALLPEEPGVSRTFAVDSLIDGSDLFGVSIEQVGALTDSGPIGPVIAHGDFLPKSRSK